MDDTLHEEDDLMIFEDLEKFVRQMCLCLYVCIVNLYFVNLVLVKTTFPQKKQKQLGLPLSGVLFVIFADLSSSIKPSDDSAKNVRNLHI